LEAGWVGPDDVTRSCCCSTEGLLRTHKCSVLLSGAGGLCRLEMLLSDFRDLLKSGDRSYVQ